MPAEEMPHNGPGMFSRAQVLQWQIPQSRWQAHSPRCARQDSQRGRLRAQGCDGQRAASQAPRTRAPQAHIRSRPASAPRQDQGLGRGMCSTTRWRPSRDAPADLPNQSLQWMRLPPLAQPWRRGTPQSAARQTRRDLPGGSTAGQRQVGPPTTDTRQKCHQRPR